MQKVNDFGLSAGLFPEENLSQGAPGELPERVSPRGTRHSVSQSHVFLNFSSVLYKEKIAKMNQTY